MNKQHDQIRLTALGVRGSMPVSRPDAREFGGATSCYRIDKGENTLFLDAGTGLMNAEALPNGPLHILLTHLHADHILGLPLFSALFQKDREIHLYSGEPELENALNRLISPPLWPITLAQYPARMVFHTLSFPCQIGPFTVSAMKSCHPGGSLIFRVSDGAKSIVYATDFEHTDNNLKELAAFSAGADLMLYDAQYTQEQYPARRGFGHSTAEAGLWVQQESGAAQIRMIHHNPVASDEALREREEQTRAPYARQGEVILL